MPVTVFSYEVAGATHWAVTTDLPDAQRRLEGVAMLVLAEADIVEVLEDQYEGTAMLGSFP